MSRAAADSARAARLLPASEAAERLGRSPVTLRNWRWRGEGPAYVRFGNRVHYTEAAIAKWIADHEVDPAGSDS